VADMFALCRLIYQHRWCGYLSCMVLQRSDWRLASLVILRAPRCMFYCVMAKQVLMSPR